MNNNSVSLLTYQESTAVKGLLIILITLGHNMFFTSQTEEAMGMGYLYCFHIQAFFIIPFLYGSKCLTKKRLIDYFIRFYWPFMLLSFILYMGYYVIYEMHPVELGEIIKLWIFGDYMLLKKYCGVQILWFLPAMFTFSVVKDFYYQSNYVVKGILFSLSCLCLAVKLLSQDWSDYYMFFRNIFPIGTPFSLMSGMSYIFYGVMVRNILDHNIFSRIRYVTLGLLWVILSIVYFVNVFFLQCNLAILDILMIIFPILFVFIVYKMKSYIIKMRLFYILGEKSFPIYIIHPFIGYILVYSLPDFASYTLMIRFSIIVVSLILMLSGGYLFGALVSYIPFLNRVLFPRSAKQLFSR